MTAVYLSITANGADLQHLSKLSREVEGSSLGQERGVDNAGDGLAFPLDAEMVAESLKVLAATFASAKVALDLLATWAKRRKQDSDDKMLPEPIMVTDISTGETLYVGRLLDDAAIQEIRERLNGRQTR
ncbi:hypothetical protein GCM10009867_21030 [Pedococcus aerophilus]|uniref:Uncharacterized protein n=1 Tax=Pedococcus aerophilus TaxID=436356 RepID=A0ABN3UPJ2_9MICO